MGNLLTTTAAAKDIPKTPTILCFGNSLTVGYTIVSPYNQVYNPYSKALQTELRRRNASTSTTGSSSDLQVVAVGGSGITAKELSTKQNLDAFDNVDVCQCRYSGLRRLLTQQYNNVVGVLIMSGTNDLASADVSPTEVIASIRTLHEIAWCHGAPHTIALSIPPNQHSGVPFSGDDDDDISEAQKMYAAKWKETNELIKEWACNESRTTWFDVGAVLPFDDLHGSMWESDGLHMSEQGYDFLGGSLVPVVEECLLGVARGSSALCSVEETKAPQPQLKKRTKKEEKQWKNKRRDRLRHLCNVAAAGPSDNNNDDDDDDAELLQSATTDDQSSSATIITRFSSQLNSQERRFVHGVASGLGLFHWSEGEGGHRHVCVSLSDSSSSSSAAGDDCNPPPPHSDVKRPQDNFVVFVPDTTSYRNDDKFHQPHPHEDKLRRLLSDIPSCATRMKTYATTRTTKKTTIVSSSKSLETTPFVYVQQVEALQRMASALAETTEFAVDLEMNNSRSYNGMTCLIQISTRDVDYVVDTLILWDHINGALANIFSNPDIVKVFHACSSGDIPALDRDFNIQVVNIFDTQHAAQVLLGQQTSLEYMLVEYMKVEGFNHETIKHLKQTWTCSDWRQRPLESDALLYARMDTHYLLECKDLLVSEMAGCVESGSCATDDMLAAAAAFGRGDEKTTSGLTSNDPDDDSDNDDSENDDSDKVLSMGGIDDVEEDMLCHTLSLSYKCSYRLFVAKKRPEDLVRKDKWYKQCLRSWRKRKEHRELLYEQLYVWRDALAREKDESAHWVCPSEILVKITNCVPTTSNDLIRAWSPLPDLLREAQVRERLLRVVAKWKTESEMTVDA